MIYISTGGFNKQTAVKSVHDLTKFGFKNIELSGGLYDPNLLNDLKKFNSKVNFQVHNYFPPPLDPFVFNLASLKINLMEKSLNHAKNAINFAAKLGCKYYSFHAGFLLDIEVDELGKKIVKRNINPRDEGLNIFKKNVIQLSKFAKDLGITLLIENNVLSKDNFEEFQVNLLLMSDPNECYQIIKDMPDNVKLLIDLAHLKVSANSLKFNPVDLLKVCNPWISAYHLSDNDGTKDSNNKFDEKAWFWPYLKKNLDYYSIEVYEKDLNILKYQLDLVSNFINCDD